MFGASTFGTKLWTSAPCLTPIREKFSVRYDVIKTKKAIVDF